MWIRFAHFHSMFLSHALTELSGSHIFILHLFIYFLSK